MSDSVRPHRWQPTRLPRPWDSPGKNTGVGCHCFFRRGLSLIHLQELYHPILQGDDCKHKCLQNQTENTAWKQAADFKTIEYYERSENWRVQCLLKIRVIRLQIFCNHSTNKNINSFVNFLSDYSSMERN